MTAEQLIHRIRELAAEFAKAKSERVYLEHFRKSKLAILMKKAETLGYTTAAAQEREALSEDEYMTLLKGLAAATEIEERARYDLEAAKLAWETWRTRKADERAEKKSYGA
jgi:hypothetical protein